MCKFDINLKDWKKLNTNSLQFMKMDLDKQMFKNCEKKNGLFDLSKVVICVAAAAVLVICLFIAFKIQRNKDNFNQSSEGENDQEILISLI